MYINICPLGTAGKTKCDSGVVGNARPCQGRDRGFESRLSLSHIKIDLRSGWSPEREAIFLPKGKKLYGMMQNAKGCAHVSSGAG